ncbi:MAG TPA: ferric reductase-like transmembrane domain-containing protein [Gaiellaceae bacterium]|nr:ferric reductase-like transmembrane domain-containing protein [Gaiellaceae bacterium]
MTALTWYVARSAGIVAYLLMSTSVVIGVLMSARARLSWPRFAVQEVHRFLAILTGVFIGLHGAALLADKVMPISIVQLLVPFESSYRPFAVGLGVTSALLLAAVALSNLLRKKIPFRLWRRIHYLTLAIWVTATAHGLLSGTDRRDVWFIALVGAAVCTVGFSFLGRFARTVSVGAIGGVAATAAAAVLALAFTPQPTPGHHATTLAAARPVAATVPVSYTGAIRAQVQGADNSPVLSVVGYAGTAGLRVDLLVASGQVESTSLALNFPTGGSCRGTVTQVAATGLTGSCGSHTVNISWLIASDRTVTGDLALSSRGA